MIERIVDRLLLDRTVAAVIVLLLIIFFVAALIALWVKQQERADDKEQLRPCCRYCAYWFIDSKRGPGICEKHSTATNEYRTAAGQCCKYYDGFVPWEENHG